MAFTGSATVVVVADGIARITGLSLAAGAAGTIGLHGSTSTPGVELPAEFMTGAGPYVGPDGAVGLQDAVEVTAAAAAVGTATAIPVAIVKSGTTYEGFLATLTNTHASTATPALEIYVKFHT